MSIEPCRCGSGLPAASCHSLTATPSLRLEALAWIHGLAGWFPFLRPRGAEFACFAERVADELGHRDHEVPSRRVEEGVVLLFEIERARLVRAFADRQGEQWKAVTTDLGDDAAARRALVAGAVRAAIDDRRAPPRRVLEYIDSGVAPASDPRAALRLVLDPSAVWDIDAAQEASAEGLVPARITVLAVGRLEEVHGRRVARLAGHLARHLPFEGLPRTSALLDESCRFARSDEAFASAVAVDSLVIYAAHRAAHAASRN